MLCEYFIVCTNFSITNGACFKMYTVKPTLIYWKSAARIKGYIAYFTSDYFVAADSSSRISNDAWVAKRAPASIRAR